MVVTFKHIRYKFKFDLCHDFSFWEAETRRCIPKKVNEFYTFPPLCNRTEFNCMLGMLPFYCPNKDKSCEGYDHFSCNNSKTCIPKGDLFDMNKLGNFFLTNQIISEKTCDGIFHCLYGEDEQFELCKDTFPKEATI